MFCWRLLPPKLLNTDACIKCSRFVHSCASTLKRKKYVTLRSLTEREIELHSEETSIKQTWLNERKTDGCIQLPVASSETDETLGMKWSTRELLQFLASHKIDPLITPSPFYWWHHSTVPPFLQPPSLDLAPPGTCRRWSDRSSSARVHHHL